MGSLVRELAAPGTYRRVGFVLSAFVLGHVWFLVLVIGWSLTASVLITPLVIPALLALAAVARGCARIEAGAARSLLEVDVEGPGFPPRGLGFWRYMGAMLGGPFWRAQAYLLVRWLVGVPLSVALIALLAASVGLIFAPVWVLTGDGAHIGGWHVHTVAQSLVFIPLGLLLLPASILLGALLARPFRPLASSLLAAGDGVAGGAARGAAPAVGAAIDGTGRSVGTVTVDSAARARRRRTGLRAHAAADVLVFALLIAVWALTSRGYFWPVWVALVLALAIAIHGWFVFLAERPEWVVRHFRSHAIAGFLGVCGAVELYLIGIWAAAGGGYFWPVWPLLVMALTAGVWVAAAWLSSPREAEMSERIDTLESTRAGAVDEQESELRRIERDLHDGAQARLVALGMSLGMAEHTLAEDPERAGKLLAEARVGAEEALKELRDLARGIHPPVLSDRGLEAAIQALLSATPLPVSVSVALAGRLPPVVESTAYFVVAEALANAGKYAHASHIEIVVTQSRERLWVEITDDGRGGADPEGGGLRGLRRRVEALDGQLSVSSPPGGPTAIRAELPCG
jgi:signal transduction histidine kinase